MSIRSFVAGLFRKEPELESRVIGFAPPLDAPPEPPVPDRSKRSAEDPPYDPDAECVDFGTEELPPGRKPSLLPPQDQGT